MYYGYQDALEAAGAEVLAYKEFGTYQGDWVALVRYGGKTSWIRDYFESCCGCDALEHFQSFGADRSEEDIGKWACDNILDNPLTLEEVRSKFEGDRSWDMNAEKALAWIDSIAGEIPQ